MGERSSLGAVSTTGAVSGVRSRFGMGASLTVLDWQPTSPDSLGSQLWPMVSLLQTASTIGAYNRMRMTAHRLPIRTRMGLSESASALCGLMVGLVLCGSDAGCMQIPAPERSLPAAVSTGRCSAIDRSTSATDLHQLMQWHINPRMSALSLYLFHDHSGTEPAERSEQVARLAAGLADCFEAAPAFFQHDEAGRADFVSYSAMQRFNASSLSHSAMTGDDVGQKHWFMHIKENCVACHDRFRFGGAESRP